MSAADTASQLQSALSSAKRELALAEQPSGDRFPSAAQRGRHPRVPLGWLQPKPSRLAQCAPAACVIDLSDDLDVRNTQTSGCGTSSRRAERQAHSNQPAASAQAAHSTGAAVDARRASTHVPSQPHPIDSRSTSTPRRQCNVSPVHVDKEVVDQALAALFDRGLRWLQWNDVSLALQLTGSDAKAQFGAAYELLKNGPSEFKVAATAMESLFCDGWTMHWSTTEACLFYSNRLTHEQYFKKSQCSYGWAHISGRGYFQIADPTHFLSEPPSTDDGSFASVTAADDDHTSRLVGASVKLKFHQAVGSTETRISNLMRAFLVHFIKVIGVHGTSENAAMLIGSFLSRHPKWKTEVKSLGRFPLNDYPQFFVVGNGLAARDAKTVKMTTLGKLTAKAEMRACHVASPTLAASAFSSKSVSKEDTTRSSVHGSLAGGFGQRMLEKMGWSVGKGCGPREDGRLEPVPHVPANAPPVEIVDPRRPNGARNYGVGLQPRHLVAGTQLQYLSKAELVDWCKKQEERQQNADLVSKAFSLLSESRQPSSAPNVVHAFPVLNGESQQHHTRLPVTIDLVSDDESAANEISDESSQAVQMAQHVQKAAVHSWVELPVTNLPCSVTVRQLLTVFENCDGVIDANVVDMGGCSRGIVYFGTLAHAEQAADRMDGEVVGVAVIRTAAKKSLEMRRGQKLVRPELVQGQIMPSQRRHAIRVTNLPCSISSTRLVEAVTRRLPKNARGSIRAVKHFRHETNSSTASHRIFHPPFEIEVAVGQIRSPMVLQNVTETLTSLHMYHREFAPGLACQPARELPAPRRRVSLRLCGVSVIVDRSPTQHDIAARPWKVTISNMRPAMTAEWLETVLLTSVQPMLISVELHTFINAGRKVPFAVISVTCEAAAKIVTDIAADGGLLSTEPYQDEPPRQSRTQDSPCPPSRPCTQNFSVSAKPTERSANRSRKRREKTDSSSGSSSDSESNDSRAKRKAKKAKKASEKAARKAAKKAADESKRGDTMTKNLRRQNFEADESDIVMVEELSAEESLRRHNSSVPIVTLESSDEEM